MRSFERGAPRPIRWMRSTAVLLLLVLLATVQPKPAVAADDDPQWTTMVVVVPGSQWLSARMLPKALMENPIGAIIGTAQWMWHWIGRHFSRRVQAPPALVKPFEPKQVFDYMRQAEADAKALFETQETEGATRRLFFPMSAVKDYETFESEFADFLDKGEDSYNGKRTKRAKAAKQEYVPVKASDLSYLLASFGFYGYFGEVDPRASTVYAALLAFLVKKFGHAKFANLAVKSFSNGCETVLDGHLKVLADADTDEDVKTKRTIFYLISWATGWKSVERRAHEYKERFDDEAATHVPKLSFVIVDTNDIATDIQHAIAKIVTLPTRARKLIFDSASSPHQSMTAWLRDLLKAFPENPPDGWLSVHLWGEAFHLDDRTMRKLLKKLEPQPGDTQEEKEYKQILRTIFYQTLIDEPLTREQMDALADPKRRYARLICTTSCGKLNASDTLMMLSPAVFKQLVGEEVIAQGDSQARAKYLRIVHGVLRKRSYKALDATEQAFVDLVADPADLNDIKTNEVAFRKFQRNVYMRLLRNKKKK